MRPSVSMIVPAYDEEANLADTVRTVTGVLAAHFDDYEVLIVNDGSRDGTGRVAEALAAADPCVRILHNSTNIGLGACYRKALAQARKDYVGWAPGKNSIPADAFAALFAAVGTADIVAAYLQTDDRSWTRRALSHAFTTLLRVLFGVRLRYFNGPNLLRTDLARAVEKSTNSFAFMAEIMIRLVRAGHSVVEVGIHNRDRARGKSKAFAPRNIARVLGIVGSLFAEIRLAGPSRAADVSLPGTSSDPRASMSGASRTA